MSTSALVPVEEYPRTTYRPDRDYVDGEVIERKLGEKDHSGLQRKLIVYFASREKEWRAFCFPEQRVQVAPRRFRVPDVCVVLSESPTSKFSTVLPFCASKCSPRMTR